MVNLPWWSCVSRNSSYNTVLPLLCPAYASCLGLCSSTSASGWKQLPKPAPTHRDHGTKGSSDTKVLSSCLGTWSCKLTPCCSVVCSSHSHSGGEAGQILLRGSRPSAGFVGREAAGNSLCCLRQACSPPTQTGSFLGEAMPNVAEHLGVSLHD